MADTIKCPNCSANLRFDADLGRLVCDFCGADFAVDALDTKVDELEREEEKIPEQPAPAEPVTSEAQMEEDMSDQMQEFVCNACGATVVADRNTSASFCAFCGSPALVGQRLTNEFKPRYIIPFKYGREKAVNKFFQWCKGGRLTPVGFVSDKNIEKLTGLYVPFWLYHIDGKMDIKAKATKSSSVTTGNKTVTTTSFYEIIREGKYTWDKIPLDAETRIDDALMEAIEPYDFKDIVDYDYKYIPGFFADRYDLKSDSKELHDRILARSKAYMNEEYKSSIKKYTTCKLVSDNSGFMEPVAEYALLPVWFLHYRYLGKDYNFAMNGQTGEVAGVPPTSVVKKVVIFSVALAVLTIITKIIVGLILGGYVG